ncbi:hypothetical protein H2201_004570 [Coniosporium apollinis]|uniref:F-box domain-containing protein n=1 Tax=Coniosporium apollinis TaxID=61459 RepID=A0ABQ9NTQ6_9PEZI|nr:hypothetical protein H2201_004570 [Coniosporium apollinis]
MPSLVQLPVDLVEEIASHLDLPSLRALRLTRKIFVEHTFKHFTSTYFTVLEHTEHCGSIRRVQCVSAHQDLRVTVKTLVLGAFSIAYDGCRKFGRSALSTEELLMYCKIVNDLRFFWDSGYDVARLALSMVKFSNLDTLFLTDDYTQSTGFKWSDGLYYDPPEVPSRAPEWDPIDTLVPALTALAAAGKTIRALHCGVHDYFDQFRLDIPTLQLKGLKPVLENIRYWLRRFLSAIPRLEELGIAAHSDDERRPRRTILTQLARLNLPALKRFELMNLPGYATDLQQILDNRKATLTSLEFKYVSLHRHEDVSWVTVLTSLAHFPMLDRFTIKRVGDDGGSVSFQAYEGRKRRDMMRYPLGNYYGYTCQKCLAEAGASRDRDDHDLVGVAVRPGLDILAANYHEAPGNWTWDDGWCPCTCTAE